MQWHQLDHMLTICTSLQTDNHTSTSSLNFYRPGALRDAQRTVSKHWSQIHTVLISTSETSWSLFFCMTTESAVCCSRIWLKECRAAKRDCTGRNRWMKLCRFWNSLECFERFDTCWLCYSSICVCIFQTMSFSQNHSNQRNRWMENSWHHPWLPNLCYSWQITFSVRSI